MTSSPHPLRHVSPKVLTGKKVLIPLGPDFEDREVVYPYYRFQEAGASVTLAGIGATQYQGKYGLPLQVNAQCEALIHEPWDIIMVPGGWAPDKMRMNQALLDIIQATHENPHAVIASICHGGWVLTSARIIQGRRVTSYCAIKDDLVFAGGLWEDAPVVIDTTPNKAKLVTSRHPADLALFGEAILSCFAYEIHRS
ncbi:MAG: DJ-1/PfpI family protein [Vampirovibrionales bacterium]